MGVFHHIQSRTDGTGSLSQLLPSELPVENVTGAVLNKANVRLQFGRKVLQYSTMCFSTTGSWGEWLEQIVPKPECVLYTPHGRQAWEDGVLQQTG